MRHQLSRDRIRGELARRVEEISGQNLFTCYQCGNCTAGCPASSSMDVGPHQVIRYLLLGMEEEALAAKAPWLCASCLQCTSRCPKGVDTARLMDAVRTVMLRDNRRQDRMDVQDLPAGAESFPQMALIGGFRKFTT